MSGIFFGLVGMCYFIYGRKQENFIAVISGILLCVYPYFVSNVILLIVIGIILMAIPFFVHYDL